MLKGTILWLGLLLAGTVHGGLTFESTSQSADAKATDTELTVEYAFKNTSSEPVRIEEIDSTCGCIKASTDKRVYAPGESGVTEAVFSLGKFVGTHQKVIYVQTAEPDDVRHKLTVTVNIPEVVSIEPKVTKWPVGSAPEAKVIDVKFVGDEAMKVTEIRSTRPQFTFESETVEEGRHYRITLKPESTDVPIMGALKIVTDSKTPKYQSELAFFNVSRERATAE